MFSYQRRLFYPVHVEQADPKFGNILMEHYGGKDSEFSATTQYLNHCSNMPNPYVRDLLGLIAAEELGHMEMIAVAINKLGGPPPSFVNSKGVAWSVNYVNQSNNVIDMLRADEDAEIRAKILYSYHMTLTNDPCMKKMIQFLSGREDVHQRLFAKAGVLIAQGGSNEQFSALIHEYKMSLRIME
ncbi:MAG: manganese catalase family protein [Eubacteriales bacterium]